MIPLDNLITQYLDHLQSAGLSVTTQGIYASYVRAALLRGENVLDVDACLDHYRKTYRPSTLGQRAGALNRFNEFLACAKLDVSIEDYATEQAPLTLTEERAEVLEDFTRSLTAEGLHATTVADYARTAKKVLAYSDPVEGFRIEVEKVSIARTAMMHAAWKRLRAFLGIEDDVAGPFTLEVAILAQTWLTALHAAAPKLKVAEVIELRFKHLVSDGAGRWYVFTPGDEAFRQRYLAKLAAADDVLDVKPPERYSGSLRGRAAHAFTCYRHLVGPHHEDVPLLPNDLKAETPVTPRQLREVMKASPRQG